MNNRAYSLLEVKEYDDEQRILRGMATTPTPDRAGDIVEPYGVKSEPSIPLFLYHDSKQVVGTVTLGPATNSGIPFVAVIPKIAEAGRLRDRVDEAWQMVKYKLITGVSIGFKPVREKMEQLKGGGIRFMEAHVVELSLVPIPMHQDARISVIKALDDECRAASGKETFSVVRLEKSPPGVSGAHKYIPKGIEMKTVQEQISGFDARRQQVASVLTDIMTKSGDEGATLDAEQKQKYDEAKGELKEIDEHIVRLKDFEATMLTKAVPITPESGRTQDAGSNARMGVITVKDNLEPGIKFTRYVKCLAMANGNRMEALEIAKGTYPDMPALHTILKAAVAAGTTQGTTWAKPLVEYQTYAGDFIEYLRPATIIGKFGTGNIPNLMRVPFNVHIKGQTSGGDGYWVGEGASKPITSFDFNDIYIGYTKLANIAVVTEELLRFSSPAAEGIVRKALADALIARMDVDFIDPAKAAVTNVSPASITNGVTAITATGGTIENLRADIASLWSAWLTNNLGTASAVYITDAITALQIGTLRNAFGQPEFPGLGINGGTLDGVPVIVTQHVPRATAGGKLILVNASEIFLADDGDVSIDISREASLQMDNAPTNNSATPTATTLVSMFATNSVAIRAERFCGWQKRRASAAQYITGAAYDGT